MRDQGDATICPLPSHAQADDTNIQGHVILTASATTHAIITTTASRPSYQDKIVIREVVV
jgi:hypothetical protein